MKHWAGSGSSKLLILKNCCDRNFSVPNEELLTAKNNIAYRRDLASPLSEVLGVLLFTIVLYYGGRLVLRGELLEASAFPWFPGYLL